MFSKILLCLMNLATQSFLKMLCWHHGGRVFTESSGCRREKMPLILVFSERWTTISSRIISSLPFSNFHTVREDELKVICPPPRWLSWLDFCPGRDLMAREYEPHIRLCADNLEPGACFGFCVSLSFSLPLPSCTLCLSLKNKNTFKKKSSAHFSVASQFNPSISTHCWVSPEPLWRLRCQTTSGRYAGNNEIH